MADLKSVARRLVAWCGLDWDPACPTFHEGRRRVRSASLAQVCRPLYTQSVGRWKNYEQALARLLAWLQPTDPLQGADDDGLVPRITLPYDRCS